MEVFLCLVILYFNGSTNFLVAVFGFCFCFLWTSSDWHDIFFKGSVFISRRPIQFIAYKVKTEINQFIFRTYSR
uniref:Uncharacterized protein n=4 Tax=Cercopithecinae TaxID=9528 RepID=A0A2K5KHQ1_CERAT|nr:hypothetical protein [Macaca fascicularis]